MCVRLYMQGWMDEICVSGLLAYVYVRKDGRTYSRQVTSFLMKLGNNFTHILSKCVTVKLSRHHLITHTNVVCIKMNKKSTDVCIKTRSPPALFDP